MKISKAIAFAAISIMLFDSLGAQDYQLPDQPSVSAPVEIEDPVKVQAQLIEEEAKSIIRDEYNRYTITATYNKGVLTLRGLVRSEFERQSIETRMQHIYGVNKVDNLIHVGPPIPRLENESGIEYVPE